MIVTTMLRPSSFYFSPFKDPQLDLAPGSLIPCVNASCEMLQLHHAS